MVLLGNAYIVCSIHTHECLLDSDRILCEQQQDIIYLSTLITLSLEIIRKSLNQLMSHCRMN